MQKSIFQKALISSKKIQNLHLLLRDDDKLKKRNQKKFNVHKKPCLQVDDCSKISIGYASISDCYTSFVHTNKFELETELTRYSTAYTST
jgi:hypothetical protein